MDESIIKSLAGARADREKADSDLKQLEATFKASEEYQRLANIKKMATDLEATFDETLRNAALTQYTEDGEKKAAAYDIKLTSSVKITDEAAAIKWSLNNFTPALSLNKKVFETAVKAGSIPTDLAEVEETPKVFIHSDLSNWLPKGQ
jgi:hypothetical protein